MPKDVMDSRKQSITSETSKREEATRAVFRIKDCYPNSGGQSREYFLNLIAAAERYPVEIIRRIADLHDGLPAKLKFIPTVADIVQFCNELAKPRENKFASVPSPWPKLTGSSSSYDPRTEKTMEQRKEFVIAELGYDPMRKKAAEWCFKPRSLDELASLPPAKPSAELIADSLEHQREIGYATK